MDKLFNYNGPVLQTINKLVDCVFLSILWLLCSIPILTLGASTTALYYTANKVLRHDRSSIGQEFFGAFKSNFKQSTIVWMIVLVFYYILSLDSILIYEQIKGGKAVVWSLIPFVVLILYLTVWVIYVFACIARFENSLKTTMKNCVFFTVRHLLRMFLICIIFVVEVLLVLYMPFLIIIVPAAGMYLVNSILESIFVKYMSAEDLAAEEERNRVHYN